MLSTQTDHRKHITWWWKSAQKGKDEERRNRCQQPTSLWVVSDLFFHKIRACSLILVSFVCACLPTGECYCYRWSMWVSSDTDGVHTQYKFIIKTSHYNKWITSGAERAWETTWIIWMRNSVAETSFRDIFLCVVHIVVVCADSNNRHYISATIMKTRSEWACIHS